MAPAVAIIGSNGFLFQPIVDAITSDLFKDKYAFPIRVLTRDPSKAESSELVTYYKNDYNDPSEFDDALQGVHVVINLVSPNPVWHIILDAIVRNNVPVYITSDFGCDGRKLHVKSFLDFKKTHAQKARELGVPKVVQIFTGLFQEFLVKFGTLGPNWETGTATIIGDGNAPVTITATRDIGLSVASLGYRPANEIPDFVRVQGDMKTLNEIISIYMRVTGKKVAVAYDSADTNSLHKLADGDLVHSLKIFAANPQTETFNFPSTDNEFVNPGLWKWSSIEDGFQDGLME
ncbi:hypothetical protein V1517DRAFT_188619 [Lipomyces orientalis]|uniref:Uncharacterized protein n=1 Tax=Lipomyces orientalis TaxID=1233043 RepID=A0ACC3TIZ5_9ASCO